MKTKNITNKQNDIFNFYGLHVSPTFITINYRNLWINQKKT